MNEQQFSSCQTAKAKDFVDALENERQLARGSSNIFNVDAVCVANDIPEFQLSPVEGEFSSEELDSLDGLRVHWNGMPYQSMKPKISVVDAEHGIVRFVGRVLPAVGSQIRALPMDYLEPVIELWRCPAKAERFLAQFDRFSDEKPSNRLRLDTHPLAQNLFPEQSKALMLPNYNITYIWGTGGAGKTTTVSALIAAYMAMRPDARILVCALSNRGVDEVIIKTAETAYGQFRCKRYGQSYDKQRFEPFQGLLPGADDEFCSGVRSGNPFFEEENSIPSGVSAFTVNSALSRFSQLSENTWDLVIVDEASQIPLSHALPIMSLAKSVMFVGDPAQCSPVAKTKNHFWKSLVGASPFEFLPPEGNRMVMLARQARMPHIISAWAGQEFYDNKLQLAHEVAINPYWVLSRQRPFAHLTMDQHFSVVNVLSCSLGGSKQVIRECSASKAVELILAGLNQGAHPSEIAFISPFNGQANLCRALLRRAGVFDVICSTSHRLQGAQFPFVLFDPVHGAGGFMCSNIGRQILNVGATRAMCKLIWLVSDEDLTNPWLKRIREFEVKPFQLTGHKA